MDPGHGPGNRAAIVAHNFLQADLHAPHDAEQPPVHTLVLIHDSCYAHRFSRPKTSKSSLNLIVERPERLQAAVLGISSAYVRLGQRHAHGSSPPRPISSTFKPPRQPFNIRKTTRIVPLTNSAVSAVHGQRWMQDLSIMCESAEAKLLSTGRELIRPDTPMGSTAVQKPTLHEGDLFLCKDSRDALQGCIGGVLDAVDAVFATGSNGSPSHKRAFVAIRPPGHHCSADVPSGFCWLNNVHVAIEHAAQVHNLTHAAIIDFDLHHGDGSQEITWERNNRATKAQKSSSKSTAPSKKTSIGYFSLHDINSYPCESGDFDKVRNASVQIENAHGQSIWNVHLQPWKTEEEFWTLYRTKYAILLEKTRNFLKLHTQRIRSTSPSSRPKAAIFLSAGFDASEWEMESMQRHKVNVPTSFYAKFTSDVVKLAEEHGLATDGRVISVFEGGYSDRAIMSGIMSHVCGLAGGTQAERTSHANLPTPPPTLSPDVGHPDENDVEASLAYHTSWWSLSSLQELEALRKPIAPAPTLAKKSRNNESATYASPTQSFTAKVVDTSKIYRSISGNLQATPPRSRTPTPPPPDVDWTIAANELCKILVPSNQIVSSCKHEDLNEPKVKVERRSSIGSVMSVDPANGMQLRVRKAREARSEVSAQTSRPMSRADRRRTVADLPFAIDEKNEILERPSTAGPEPQSTKPARHGTLNFGGSSPSNRSPRSREPSRVRSSGSRQSSSALSDFSRPPTSYNAPPLPRVPNQYVEVSKSLSGNTDMDALTSGVKKLVLKPPREGSAEVPGKPVTAVKMAPKLVKKPAAPRPKPVSRTSGKLVPVTSTKAKIQVPSITSEPVSKPNAFDDVFTSPASTAPATQITHVQEQPKPDMLTNESQATQFVHYVPPGSDVQSNYRSEIVSKEPLTWLPPNTSTPTSTPLKPNLPTFTAQGYIPFAVKEVVLQTEPENEALKPEKDNTTTSQPEGEGST